MSHEHRPLSIAPQAIANSQHFVAQKLNVKDMDRVLDMGCGIGGPLRRDPPTPSIPSQAQPTYTWP